MKENKEKKECFNAIINNEDFGIGEDMKNKLEFFKENFSQENFFSQYENNLNGKVFSSHEGLLLRYEECFVRKIEEKFYDLSANFLWIGN